MYISMKVYNREKPTHRNFASSDLIRPDATNTSISYKKALHLIPSQWQRERIGIEKSERLFKKLGNFKKRSQING